MMRKPRFTTWYSLELLRLTVEIDILQSFGRVLEARNKRSVILRLRGYGKSTRDDEVIPCFPSDKTEGEWCLHQEAMKSQRGMVAARATH